MTELYSLARAPQKNHNLISDPAYADLFEKLKKGHQRLISDSGAVPDVMPLDEGI